AREACGETTILVLYDRARRQVAGVAAAEPIKPVRYATDAARAFTDLHRTARGKGMLAFMPEAEQEEILADLPDPVGGPGSSSKADLREQLAKIARRGWAPSSSNETGSGAEGVCAPVVGGSGDIIGGVLI